MFKRTWTVENLIEGGALQASVTLATNGEEVLLVDTGYPRQQKQLLEALESRGFNSRSVTKVVNTHLHFDHSHNNCLFPRAEVICSRREFDWMMELCGRLMRDNLTLDEIFKFYPELKAYEDDPKVIWSMVKMVQRFWSADRLGRREQFLWLEENALPDGIRAMHTPGHVPFHYSFVFDSVGGPLLVAGDAMLTRGFADQNAMTFPPTHRSLYEETKRKLKQFKGVIVPGHDVQFHGEEKPEKKRPRETGETGTCSVSRE